MEITIVTIAELEDEEDPTSNFKLTPCFFLLLLTTKIRENLKRCAEITFIKFAFEPGNDLFMAALQI